MTEKSTERSDNDNKNHKQKVPQLRFPGFNGEWEEYKLNDLVTEIKRRKENIYENDEIYTISSKKGFISQKERFNQIIAGNSLKKYTYLKKDEFSYNRGNSKTYPYGCIYRLNIDSALVPNVYRSFKIKKGEPLYYEQLFKSKKLDKELIKIITSTARMDGLLNISAKDFFNVKISVTNYLEEQEKIGNFLSTLDRKIELMEKKKIHFQRIKKYFLSNMFCDKQNVPQLRFPGFNGEWKLVKMTEIANVKGGKRIPKGYSLTDINNNHPYITISDMENGTVSLSNIKYVPDDVVEQISNYTIYEEDLFVSVAGTLGLVGKIPPELNGANLTENADKITDIKVNQNFLVYILNTSILNKLIHKTKTDNAQPKLAIKELRDMKFYIPTTKEQEKIANFISIIDSKVKLMENEILKNQQFKNSLLSKMFC